MNTRALEILLHYYQYFEHRPTAAGEKEEMKWLMKNELIRPSGATFEVTARGKAFVMSLQDLPLPQPVVTTTWVMP